MATPLPKLLVDVADPTPDALAAILQRLDTMCDELRRIREASEQRPARARLGCTLAEASTLVAAIAGAVGEYAFLASDLFDCVPSATGATLKAAIGACGTPTPRGLGRLLKRLEGESFDGLTVQRDSEQRGCILWKVSRV